MTIHVEGSCGERERKASELDVFVSKAPPVKIVKTEAAKPTANQGEGTSDPTFCEDATQEDKRASASSDGKFEGK